MNFSEVQGFDSRDSEVGYAKEFEGVDLSDFAGAEVRDSQCADIENLLDGRSMIYDLRLIWLPNYIDLQILSDFK
jgi:hypothetical protein